MAANRVIAAGVLAVVVKVAAVSAVAVLVEVAAVAAVAVVVPAAVVECTMEAVRRELRVVGTVADRTAR